ncbi:MAG: uncharacterized protein KVP18_001712 [Porospora cf. gigantea A]|uniref:uncharacterized protein n=1 Tax=Porospora cf. gigantea A TaxID=2853593 RepID=UPI00355AC4A9|nr:MAG: hypothetical protein KVP18_001712 [Porospora cf. gigantea A]
MRAFWILPFLAGAQSDIEQMLQDMGEPGLFDEDALRSFGLPQVPVNASHLSERMPELNPESTQLMGLFEDFQSGMTSWIESDLEKYNGVWSLRTHETQALRDDMGLQMTSETAFYAISRSLGNASWTNTTTRMRLSYEVAFQQDFTCGGAYVKLYSSSAVEPKKFGNESPYTLMFGPDKCGGGGVVHVIFKTSDGREFHPATPINAEWGEYTHLFELDLAASGHVEVLIDGATQAELTLADFVLQHDSEEAVPPDFAVRDVIMGSDTLGFELWTVQSGTLFDNIAVFSSTSDNYTAQLAALKAIQEDSWGRRHAVEERMHQYVQEFRREMAAADEPWWLVRYFERHPMAMALSLALTVALGTAAALWMCGKLCTARRKGTDALDEGEATEPMEGDDKDKAPEKGDDKDEASKPTEGDDEDETAAKMPKVSEETTVHKRK